MVNHKHCQATVLPASGKGDGTGRSWSVLENLVLGNLPNGWLDTYFKGNGNNITQDFGSILKILNTSVGNINQEIELLNHKTDELQDNVNVIAGKTTGLTTGTITCYIAPNKEWFDDNASDNATDTTKRFIHHNGDEQGREYYTVNPNYNWGGSSVPQYAYAQGTEHRLYPGDDDNLHLQYAVESDSDRETETESEREDKKKKYPVFTLNAAMEYLRRFRANGAVKYKVLTQYGEYHYATNTQTVMVKDATAGSTLYIGPDQSTTQLQAMPCMNLNYSGYTNAYFNDSDVVRVKFIWDDTANLNDRGAYHLTFQESTTTFDGIGVTVVRNREIANYNSLGASFLDILVNSGYVTFTQCVFRNVHMNPDASSANSPVVIFKYKEARKARKLTGDNGVTYSLSQLHYVALPCVFVDDPPIDGVTSDSKRYISTEFISSGASDNLKLFFQYSYMVFRLNRPKPLITLHATNSMLYQISCLHLGKWVVYYVPSIADHRNYVFIDNKSMSTIRRNQASTPISAVNQQPYEQSRIEIVNKNETGGELSTPEWLISPYSIMSINSFDYDQQTGAYNDLSTYFNLYPNFIVYNGKSPIKVIFDKESGTGGTNEIYAFNGRPMPAISQLPTRTGYAFAGYYENSTNGKQYYKADGTSANNWDKSTETTLHARWTAKSYTVTLNKQNGSGSDQVTLIYNADQSPITPPTRDGYIFGGYFAELNGDGKRYYKPNGERSNKWDIANNATIYAKWTAKTYAITLDPNGGSGGTSAITATYGQPLPGIRLPTKTDYYCSGYNVKKDGSSTQWYTYDEETPSYGICTKNWSGTHAYTLYAQWA